MEQKLLDSSMHQYKKSFSDNTKGKKKNALSAKVAKSELIWESGR